jgi:hypothetical protein
LSDELERRRRAQHRVEDVLREVASMLAAGDTELRGARLIRERLPERWFHEPYVWFGDRTAPRGSRRASDFRPSERRLEPGMPVILDAAPYVDGFVVDVSYTFSFGDNAELARLLVDLAAIRELILERARAAVRPSEIYRAVEEEAAARGCRTCHGLIPFGPLAHRVDRVRLPRVGANVAGVDVATLAALGAGELLARVPSWPVASPLWTAATRSSLVGLWSVEPHVARGDVGAKFEQLLVVRDHGAEWL